jgi:hypothetical protein
MLVMGAAPAAQLEGNLTRWTVGDVRLKMRTNPTGSADFHAAFQQTEQSARWAGENAACSYRALALRARDDEGFPTFSLDLVCPALGMVAVGATVDCDGFMYRAPRVSEATRFDLNLAARGCP